MPRLAFLTLFVLCVELCVATPAIKCDFLFQRVSKKRIERLNERIEQLEKQLHGLVMPTELHEIVGNPSFDDGFHAAKRSGGKALITISPWRETSNQWLYPAVCHEVTHAILEANLPRSRLQWQTSLRYGGEELFINLSDSVLFEDPDIEKKDVAYLLDESSLPSESSEHTFATHYMNAVGNGNPVTFEHLEKCGPEEWWETHIQLSIARYRIWEEYLARATADKQNLVFRALVPSIRQYMENEAAKKHIRELLRLGKKANFDDAIALNNIFLDLFRENYRALSTPTPPDSNQSAK